jgi:hypothetical protein
MSRRPLLLLALSGAALLGCGSDESKPKFEGEKADVAAVIDKLGQAARDGDGATVCNDLFTSNLRISVRRASHRPCADEVTQNIVSKDTKYTVEDVSVIGANATAHVKDQEDRKSALLLQKSGNTWRIARIG